MSPTVSAETEAQAIANAESMGVSVDVYISRLLEAADERAFIEAAEQGLADVEAGRVQPTRQALTQLADKLGFSRGNKLMTEP